VRRVCWKVQVLMACRCVPGVCVREALGSGRPIAVLLCVLDHWTAVASPTAARLMAILCELCAACLVEGAREKSAGDETEGRHLR
jgi:hypothetical protein